MFILQKTKNIGHRKTFSFSFSHEKRRTFHRNQPNHTAKTHKKLTGIHLGATGRAGALAFPSLPIPLLAHPGNLLLEWGGSFTSPPRSGMGRLLRLSEPSGPVARDAPPLAVLIPPPQLGSHTPDWTHCQASCQTPFPLLLTSPPIIILAPQSLNPG